MTQTRLAWMSPDGAAAATLPDGGIVAVAGGLPGDVVDWHETARRGRKVTGALDTLVTPSPDRRAPPCPWDARCGGCDLSAWSPAARLDGLGLMVAHAMGRTEPVQVVPSPRATGHRARIKLAIAAGRLGYRAARSHDLVEPDTCAIARPELMAVLPAVRAWVAAHPELPLTEVELRTDGTRVVAAFQASGRVPDASLADLAEVGLDGVALAGRTVLGDAHLHLTVGPLALQAGPSTFFQVNLELNELLVDHVVQAVLDASPERVLDLYAGIGNLGLSIARHGVPVFAVESHAQALSDSRATAARHGIARFETLAAPAERFEPGRTPYDVAVLDPPRAGAGDVLGRVLRNRPRRVVYVACHAPSAARDLRQHAQGYTVSSVRAFDLFPDTRHVETVIVLDRG